MRWKIALLLMIVGSGVGAKTKFPLAERFYFPIGRTTNASPYRLEQGLMEDRPGWYISYGHLGEDRSCPIGTKVYPIANGKVVLTKYTPGWGNYIFVEHRLPAGLCLPRKIYSFYAHLSEIRCKKGQIVYSGRKRSIGKSGIAGTGPHLHYEIKSKVDAGVGYSHRNSKNKRKAYYDGMWHWNPSFYINRLKTKFKIAGNVPRSSAQNLPVKITLVAAFSQPVRAKEIARRIKIVPLPQNSHFTIYRSGKNKKRLEIRGLIFNPGVTYKVTVLKGVKSEWGNTIMADYAWSFSTKPAASLAMQGQSEDDSETPHCAIAFFQENSQTGKKEPLEQFPEIFATDQAIWLLVTVRPVKLSDRLYLNWQAPEEEGIFCKEPLIVTGAHLTGKTYRSWRKIPVVRGTLGQRAGLWRVNVTVNKWSFPAEKLGIIEVSDRGD